MSSDASMRLGFVGTGLMGTGMALCALRAGHAVAVGGGRSAGSADRLVARGAERAATLSDLAAGRDAVVLCVSDPDAVRSVMGEIDGALASGTLVVDATTSDPALTRELAAALEPRGVALADAPVTGGPPEAESGGLASLVGCREDDWPRVRDLVGCWSRTVRRFGDPGAGHLAKLLNNFVTQGTAVLLAEAFAAAREHGVDAAALRDVMKAGAARSGTFEKTVVPAVDGDYDGARFSLRNSRKDVRLYREAIGRDGDPRLAEAVLATLDAANHVGHGERFISRLLDPDVWRAVDGKRRSGR